MNPTIAQRFSAGYWFNPKSGKSREGRQNRSFVLPDSIVFESLTQR